MGASISFTAEMICVIPPLPRDLADIKARIIAAVKNIDASILMRV
jgi:hypothetical protein